MTLNITAIGQEVVLEVSDRRFVNAETLALADDNANKASVIGFTNSIALLTYSGLATFRTPARPLVRMELWLAEKMQKAGIPELTPDDAAAFIAEECTKLFRVYPADRLPRQAFVLAGFDYQTGASPRSFGLVVHNNPHLQQPQRTFVVEGRMEPQANEIALLPTGMNEQFVRDKLQQTLTDLKDKTVPAEKLEQMLVTLIRSAASMDAAKGTIGKNCMAVRLSAGRAARATAYSERDSPRTYGPLVLWNTGLGNALATDIDALIGKGHHIAFGGAQSGFALEIGRPGDDAIKGDADKFTIDWGFRLGKPVFGPPPKKGDRIPFMSIRGMPEDGIEPEIIEAGAARKVNEVRSERLTTKRRGTATRGKARADRRRRKNRGNRS